MRYKTSDIQHRSGKQEPEQHALRPTTGLSTAAPIAPPAGGGAAAGWAVGDPPRVFDMTGGAWHNATVSCGSEDYHGMHYLAEDYCFRYDLIDPVSKEPIAIRDGAIGEAIHTGLEYEAAPAFRNATGDILKLEVGECPGCGRFGVRMHIVGRADDMLNVKGVKVYPSAFQDVVQLFQPRASGQLRIRLDAPPPRVEPPLKLVVEAGAALLEAEWAVLGEDIAQRCREILAIRPRVAAVPFGALPRSSQKTKLIEITE